MDTLILIIFILLGWWITQSFKKGSDGDTEIRDEEGRTFRVEDLNNPNWQRVPRRRMRQKLPAPPPSDDFKLESTGIPTSCPTCKTVGKIEREGSGGWRCEVCGEMWFD